MMFTPIMSHMQNKVKQEIIGGTAEALPPYFYFQFYIESLPASLSLTHILTSVDMPRPL